MSISAAGQPPVRTTAVVCQDCKLSDEARALVKDEQTVNEFFDLLYERALFRDAIHLVAHLLSARQAVWWGCLCVWHVCRSEPSPLMAAALQAAVQWVREPSEDNRKAAHSPGEAAGLTNPAGCVAMAAFWSGGSMTPDNLPAVPPPPFLTAKTIAAAVLSAAAWGTPGALEDRFRQFLQFGTEVENGQNRWEVAQ